MSADGLLCARIFRRLAVLATSLSPGCGESGTAVRPDGGAELDATVDARGTPVAEHEEQVTFPSGDLVLEGTLVVPEHLEGEELPAVILAHGSGPIDRNETVSGQLGMSFGFEIRIFAELAAALSKAGYVVLRYDKRTCTSANGCENAYPTPSADIVVDDFIADVEAGLDWLATRAEVDGETLYFVGHSQGASFAPGLLAYREGLRAGVMLAGPYRPVDELLAYQAGWMRVILEALGWPSEDIDAQLAEIDRAVADLRLLRDGTFPGSSIMGTPVTFWQSWMDLGDEAPGIVATLDKPILALSGDYDWNVPPTETRLWEGTFAAVEEDPGHDAVVLPCVTHALNCIGQPDWTRVTPDDIGRNVDASVVDELLGFLNGTR